MVRGGYRCVSLQRLQSKRLADEGGGPRPVRPKSVDLSRAILQIPDIALIRRADQCSIRTPGRGRSLSASVADGGLNP